MTVVSNVRRMRIAKGMLQKDIAQKLGISTNAYSLIERGESRLDCERLKRISHVLGVKPGIFFDDDITESVIYNEPYKNGTP